MAGYFPVFVPLSWLMDLQAFFGRWSWDFEDFLLVDAQFKIFNQISFIIRSRNPGQMQKDYTYLFGRNI